MLGGMGGHHLMMDLVLLQGWLLLSVGFSSHKHFQAECFFTH